MSELRGVLRSLSRVSSFLLVVCFVNLLVYGGPCSKSAVAQIASSPETTCNCPYMITGNTSSGFWNGDAHSIPVTINYTQPCNDPLFVTQMHTTWIRCGGAGAPGACSNDRSNIYTNPRVAASRISGGRGFRALISTNNGVYVGRSGFFRFSYSSYCNTPMPSGCDCGPIRAGRAYVNYSPGQYESSVTHVDIPEGCENPVVISYSDADSALCGNANHPLTCYNSPGTTSVDLDSYVTDLTATGFDVRIRAVDTLWANGPYGVTYHIACGETDTPKPNIKKGIVTVDYSSGQNDSSTTRISLPVGCVDPAIFTQSYTVKLPCGTAGHTRRCLNDIYADYTPLRSYVTDITQTDFGVRLSTENSVWVGRDPVSYQVGYYLRCASVS